MEAAASPLPAVERRTPPRPATTANAAAPAAAAATNASKAETPKKGTGAAFEEMSKRAAAVRGVEKEVTDGGTMRDNGAIGDARRD